jgi:rubrerythrin
MDKLHQIADHYGISEVDKHEENKENFEKLTKDLALLDKQKKIVMQAVEAMTKRYETAINEKKKEYEQLYLKKATILKSYNEKVKSLR